MQIQSLKIKNVDYKITEEIGVGGQAAVFSAKNVTDHTIAVKISDFTLPRNWKGFSREMDTIQALKPWNHQYLCNILAIEELDEYGYIAMEKYDCDIFEYIERQDGISEEFGKNLFKKICIGLKNMHSSGIAHLDIKPENIMYDRKTKNPYIGDFGCSYNFSQKRTCSLLGGTQYFHPPEYASCSPFDPVKSDIFSLGVTLHVLLTGYYPYDVNENVDKRHLYINDELSPECKNLLCKMLNKNPKKRISLDGIMHHPWVLNKKQQSKLKKVTYSISKHAKNILK